jgi:hypothetical protein
LERYGAMTADKRTLGWALDSADRQRLLQRFPPLYAKVVADHVTLRSGAPTDQPLPTERVGDVVGEARDGAGVQALVVRIGGTTARPGGGVYHLTWSLGPGREAVESNAVIAEHGWTAIAPPVPFTIEPKALGED